MMNLDYKIDTNGNNYNSYNNYQFPEEYFVERKDRNFNLCLNFPYLKDIQINKHIEILRQIETFTLFKENWDGFGAIPLSKNVAEKAKIIVENIDLNYFNNINYEVKVTPYSTLIIDWFDNNNELSLEIGKDYLGYYCDSEKLMKEVEKIDILTKENISNAITQVEEDIRQIF